MTKNLLALMLFLIASSAIAQVTVRDKETGTTANIGLTGNQVTHGKDIPSDITDRFTPDKSTYDDVIKELGKPTSERVIQNYIMVRYTVSKANVESTAPILMAIPIVGGLASLLGGKSSMTAESRNVDFVFDKNSKKLINSRDDKLEGTAQDKSGLEKLQGIEVEVKK